MEGIEILSSRITHVPTTLCMLFFVIIFIVGAICFLMFADYKEVVPLLVGTICVVLFVCLIAGMKKNDKLGKEVYLYKVTISEDVSVLEFHNKYKIIDEEGEIFTIREREVK